MGVAATILGRWLLGGKPYGRAHLKMDVTAGLTVALVLIPQSMAYAQLAGMPFYYGLYAAFLPPAVAALLGSSRQLATGPVAVVSLMTAAALEPIAAAGSEGFIAAAVLLSLLVGAIQLAVGLLRLGVLVNLLSHPVINGFTNAAALIIASSQLAKLFGVTVSGEGGFFAILGRTLLAAGDRLHWPTFAMGLLAFGIMMGLKRLAPRSPNILVAVALTTLLSWATGFSDQVRVPAGALKYPPFHEAVARYNAAHTEMAAAVAVRNRLQAQLKDRKADLAPESRIDLERELALARLRETRAADAFKDSGAGLKRLVWVRGTDSQGEPVYHEAHHPPAQWFGTGGIASAPWRLVVGSGPIDEARLELWHGGAVVGHIPRGLPPMGLPALRTATAVTLLPYALIIALLGFMEAISIAKAMAAKTGQRIDPNRELVGQGIGNLAGALSASFPCAGSFSRSAVNLQAGARSAVASAVTSLAVLLTLLFFTPLLYHLPQSVLAAVIMMAVAGLINVRGFVHAWRAQWFDGAISVITFVATLGFAPHLDKGILLGVALSLAVFLLRNMRPKVVDLSLGVDHTLHDAVAHGLDECRYIDAVRFDGPLFFANASYLEEQIRRRRLRKRELKHIIIAAAAINDMDASGQEMLALIVERVRSAGIDISLAGVNRAVMQVLERTHLLAKIGHEHIYPDMGQAIAAVHARTHSGGEETACPLRTVCAIGEKAVRDAPAAGNQKP